MRKTGSAGSTSRATLCGRMTGYSEAIDAAVRLAGKDGERGMKPRTPAQGPFCVFPRAVPKKHQEKKAPFRSRPNTETKFALGSGGMSDSNRKPSCSADQLIVAPVLKKLPLKFCELFSICAIVRAAFHSTSKETFARTGKTPAMGGLGSPSPCVRELARSWSSKTFKSRTRKWARASSKSTSTASCLTGVIQNTSFRSTCTL